VFHLPCESRPDDLYLSIAVIVHDLIVGRHAEQRRIGFRASIFRSCMTDFPLRRSNFLSVPLFVSKKEPFLAPFSFDGVSLTVVNG
jgi:hypothetical protein